MMRKYLSVIALAFYSIHAAHAQADLFGSEKAPVRHGFIIGVNGDFDLPGADMAKRFGTSWRVGPSVLYKTESNWLFGVKADFIFGGKIKEDSLMWNLRDRDGFFISSQGDRQGIGLFERGYAIGVQVGRIIPLKKDQTNTGILVMLGAGFIQHKITIYDVDNVISQVSGNYRKGYDRLTNGVYIEPYIGYSHLAKDGLLNFHIGLDLMAGFTQGRRDYQFDLMRRDDKSRVDLLIGIRGGWYLPLFKRKSEEIYFD